LLFISPRYLLPLDQGGKIRTANILRRLKDGAFEVWLASPAPRERGPSAADIAAMCDRFLTWPALPVSPIGRLAALAGSLPVSVATDRSPEGSRMIGAALKEKPDLVVVDFPHAAVLLPPALDAPSVIFTHNVEAEIFARQVDVTTGLRRAVWRGQARKMRAFEARTLRRFDTVIAVSERDAHILRSSYGLADVAMIDTGVDVDFHAATVPCAQDGIGPTGGTIVFSGAMDSRSNIDGVTFLMDEVWPLVIRARPGARAVIIGRNPPDPLVAKAARRRLAWRFTGFVDDIRPEFAAGDVAVIPLRVGSGTRIKGFEAMAMGRPVVSTPLGVEGLPVVAGRHFLEAASADAFAAAIVRLLADAALRERVTRAARALVEARFTWDAVAAQFEAICRATLDRTRGRDTSDSQARSADISPKRVVHTADPLVQR
jgi:glycosyltransferase involved in cell wall biosynthesis